MFFFKLTKYFPIQQINLFLYKLQYKLSTILLKNELGKHFKILENVKSHSSLPPIYFKNIIPFRMYQFRSYDELHIDSAGTSGHAGDSPHPPSRHLAPLPPGHGVLAGAGLVSSRLDSGFVRGPTRLLSSRSFTTTNLRQTLLLAF